MSKSQYTPGGDLVYNPRTGAGGVFSNNIIGRTPKYAINNGYRQDFRNTLARMMVRVDRSELQQFRASISDPHVREQLFNRIAGDPTSSIRDQTASSNGYLDFLITQVTHQLQEKIQVEEVLSDNYVAYTFGQKAPVWTYQGYVLNTVQDDQASNFFRLYIEILRASQLARRQKSINLTYDSFIVNGIMMDLNMSLSGQMEQAYTLSFNLLVKRVSIINYTANWVPTRATTPFAADVNAVAYDGRPRPESNIRDIIMRAPEGTRLVPTRQNQADSRVNSLPQTPSTPVTQQRNNSVITQATVPNRRQETANAEFSQSGDALRSRP